MKERSFSLSTLKWRCQIRTMLSNLRARNYWLKVRFALQLSKWSSAFLSEGKKNKLKVLDGERSASEPQIKGNEMDYSTRNEQWKT